MMVGYGFCRSQLEREIQPGDMLVKVGDVNVNGLNREQVMRLISETKGQLKLTVTQVPELRYVLLLHKRTLSANSPTRQRRLTVATKALSNYISRVADVDRPRRSPPTTRRACG